MLYPLKQVLSAVSITLLYWALGFHCIELLPHHGNAMANTPPNAKGLGWIAVKSNELRRVHPV
jgi:hypothetical protein